MTKANFFRRSSPWVNALALLGLLLFVLPNSDALAAPAKRNVSFDHIKTGFPLTGAHVTLPCETCHTQGNFKGTPKKCATCHTQGSRIQTTTFKPTNHIVTAQACDQCHTSTASWTIAFFSHAGVTPHQCRQCHNNSTAKGKPSNHAPTDAPCDACHRTTTWMSASFTHVDVKPGSCDQCHRQGGSATTFKSSSHIPTTLPCDACHTTGGSFLTSRFTHSTAQGVIKSQCSGCHDGTHAKGKSTGHVATTASCDQCHVGFVTFVGANQHAGVIPGAGTCANSGCHAPGGAGKQKTNDHIPTGLTCNQCHNMTTFNPSSFTHSTIQGVVTGQCAGCHDGTHTSSNALGKAQAPTPHIITSASCDQCHTGFASFVGANQHAGVIASAGTCANSGCHAPGGAGMQKPTGSAHIPTTLSCNWCHNMTTFNPSSFTHASTQGVVPSQCETCHNGTYASLNVLGKAQASPAHIATTAPCDQCHTGYASFAGANFHAGVIASAGTCATSGCHAAGGAGTQKPTGNAHIPTTLSCNWCHNMTTFNPSSFTHSTTQGVVPGQCVTCHSGTYAALNVLGKPTNHIPYESQLLAGASMSCDSCHKSTTSFATQTMNHNNSQGNGSGWCKGCHASGTTYAGNMEKKSLTHEKSTGVTDCSQSGCHRPLGNRGSPYNSW
jgi:hypothetical protein